MTTCPPAPTRKFFAGLGSGAGSGSGPGLGCTLTCYWFVRSNTLIHTKRDVDLWSLRSRLRRLCRVKMHENLPNNLAILYSSTVRRNALVGRCGCSRISSEENSSE
ncbi:hypothetical protein MCOR07_003899 [Pyricularia oryzae]|uniref:Secreted protein n=1 Tax=Pyricularia grisea TaxID=148305 RepID=A0ABQ8NYZ6_PYRGI|nr:hypothetical protein MCOR19_001605 [Pyricularia oryzae]KAI6304152.1 hypothetical protein MCOR33_000900 [Pyricularia grisea]KAI6283013.1 hypothetical protein MCOR26_002557 [Pyricularia oryzae]KAI6312970.1 hypothetical protein MCOR29_007856 [Pyricularia oryzae]KAI6327526.1 hypothetical protein MCOR34_000494 [Pyricularia oryzae]